MTLRRLLPALVAATTWHAGKSDAQLDPPAGVDVWCGKAYRPDNASFNPGGQFQYPEYSEEPLLWLKAKPGMSIYLDTEDEATIIVDATVSHYLGSPIEPHLAAEVVDDDVDELGRPLGPPVKVEVFSGDELLESAVIKLGTKDNVIPIPIDGLAASKEAYDVEVKATLLTGATYTAATTLHRLPYPDNYGTVSRIDNLYGGFWYQKGRDAEWKSMFPYTYYTQWPLYWQHNLTTLDDFQAMGYNLVHLVPTGSLADDPFKWDEFQPYLDRAAELGILFQFDVIWTPERLSTLLDIVPRLRDHPSLVMWYQSDEPDGKTNPLNATGISRDMIWDLDPYHPSSLALNCENFYYEHYAKGGEVIMSDVYPISTNVTFSTEYLTPCNATYGCCGCDNCEGSFEDISDRVDAYSERDEILGWQKTQWSVPQAFGNETFWKRYPTGAEVVVMSMVAVNHGSKGLVAWNFPTTADIGDITKELAKVMTGDLAGRFLLQTPRTQKLAVQGAGRVDASVWVDRAAGQVLLSVVNLNYGDLKGEINVSLPKGVRVKSVDQVLWGDAAWEVSHHGSTLSAPAGLLGLEVSMLVLTM